jgi:TolA-binding protein
MNNSTIGILAFSVFSTILSCSEPSAFGAGDLTNPSPYGLTSNEKVILDTKTQLKKVAIKSNNQDNKLNSLRDRIDGLQSIVESLSRKSHTNKLSIEKQNELIVENSKNNDEFQSRIEELAQSNTEKLNNMKLVLKEMSKILDEINAQYISRSEFNTLVDDVNNFKKLMAKELKTTTRTSSTKSSKSKFSSMSNKEIYDKANAYFKKKYYTNAIEYFEYLIKNNYKPAYSHYMIGEMYYKRKNYANAISYFKKSSSLYSKAKYMPNLMLHTAISMKKTGDRQHADAFFNAIVSKYPNSAEAKEAKKYIQQ